MCNLAQIEIDRILVQNEESDPGTRYVCLYLVFFFLFWVRYFYDDIEPGYELEASIGVDNFKSSKAPLICIKSEEKNFQISETYFSLNIQ